MYSAYVFLTIYLLHSRSSLFSIDFVFSCPVGPQTHQVFTCSNPSPGFSGGRDSSLGDLSEAYSDREAPRDTGKPDCTAGVCLFSFVFFF